MLQLGTGGAEQGDKTLVGKEVAGSCTVSCCCAGTWQHPVSTLQEGAPSFFLTWPDSFSEEIYTGTGRNICHSKPPWSREMRHCEPLSWDLTLFRAEILFQEKAQSWVLLDTPEWRVPGLHQYEACTLGFIWLCTDIWSLQVCSPASWRASLYDQGRETVTSRAQFISF